MDGYYHTVLPNGYEIETIADDFDREYFTGNIKKKDDVVVWWVRKIKINGDTIYGERYDVNEAPGSEYYFSLNTATNELMEYTSYEEAKKTNPMAVTELTPPRTLLLQKLEMGHSVGCSCILARIRCGLPDVVYC